MDAGTATVITTAIMTARPYLDQFFKGTATQIGAMFSESAGLWRMRNRLKVLKKAKAICDKRGVKPEKVLPDVLIPLMDAAGDTEDPTLSDMFAHLLASNLDPSKQDKVHPAFSKVISQFSPQDAKLLEALDSICERNSGRAPEERVKPVAGYLRTLTKMQFVPVAVHLENLERLGLITTQTRASSPTGRPWTIVDTGEYRFTKIGCRFMSAVSKKKPHWRDGKEEKLEDWFQQTADALKARRNRRKAK
jgi:hypothetical protein